MNPETDMVSYWLQQQPFPLFISNVTKGNKEQHGMLHSSDFMKIAVIYNVTMDAVQVHADVKFCFYSFINKKIRTSTYQFIQTNCNSEKHFTRYGNIQWFP